MTATPRRSARARPRRTTTRETLETAAQIFALANLAIAQPLYEVLRKSPDFFAAHGAGPSDLAALILALSLLPAMSLILAVWTAGLLGSKSMTAVHRFLVGALCLVILLPIVKRFFDSSATIPIAALTSSVLAVLIHRYRFPRASLVMLAPLTIVFPSMFLADSNVWTLLRVDWTDPGTTERRIETPLVMVVLDQLPTAALLDGHGQIDAARYPNIAALALASHWFRNHTTVAQDTTTAIPAILTGRYPTGKLPPTLRSYPKNAFTLFNSFYDFNVFEEVTALCPPNVCSERPSFSHRIVPLLEDVGILFCHVVAPKSLARRLPGVEDQVAFFADGPAAQRRYAREARIEKVADFLTRLDGRDGVFHYLHILLPHTPYQFYPSGTIYSRKGRIPGLAHAWGDWGDDREPVDKARQRFLLQTLLADRLLGDVVARMKAVDIYDRALLVVTSDHGASFKAGNHTRRVTANTYKDVLYVPLFIKLPHQREGVISDRNVESIDIFPTLVESLGARLGWAVDGESVFGRSVRARPVKKARCRRDGVLALHEFPAPNGGEFQELGHLMEGFEFDKERNWIRIRSRYDDWLGARIEALKRSFGSTSRPIETILDAVSGEATGAAAFEFRAGWIQGHVTPAEGSDRDHLDLAIAVDGRVAALTRTFTDGDTRHYFAELLPESPRRLDPKSVEIVVLGPAERL